MEILIAEDNAVSRNLLKKMLANQGHRVLAAENGIKAWELFQQNDIEMVITDWIMPGMDGLALCDKIRSLANESYTYVIILTAKDQKEDLVEVFNAGADDYIAKPFDPHELKARVKTGARIVDLEIKHKDLANILIESRNKLKIVFDSLQEEIVAIDDKFRIVSANNAFLRNTGTTFKEIIGKHCFKDENGSNIPVCGREVKFLVKKVIESGRPQHYLDTYADKHGEKRYKRMNCLPVKDESGKIFQLVIVLKDITDDKIKEEKIKALNKRLQETSDEIKAKNEELEYTLKRLKDTQAQILQAEKMASVGQLAAGIAHEINNPTGFVSSNLKTLVDYIDDINRLIKQYRMLITELKDNNAEDKITSSIEKQLDQISGIEKDIDLDFIMDDAMDLINDCREGTKRIKKIVLDLKDFAHPGEDTLQATDINKSIESTLNVVWNELKYKATVTKDYGKLPILKCYPQQLSQVFMNIFVNAAQAIKNQGEITISTRADDGHVEIKISDTGIGIPKENLTKLFDPFFTTKEVGKGTGLGMNIAYNIVKKHKGTIDVESEVGKGATFTIRIPVG
jgi:PAS domain S-box-containing protein